MPLVFVPTQLRRLTGGRDRLDGSGATVGELIDDLEQRFPGFRGGVVRDGDLIPGMAVAVDGETATQGLDEPVAGAREVHFVPALGGG